MGPMVYQITSLMIVYLTVYSGADQRKHSSSASLAFVRGIHQWPVNPLTTSSCQCIPWHPALHCSIKSRVKTRHYSLNWCKLPTTASHTHINAFSQMMTEGSSYFQACHLTLILWQHYNIGLLCFVIILKNDKYWKYKSIIMFHK